MNIKFNIDDIVTLDGNGEYRVLRCMPNQYTRYEVEKVWHQRKGVTEIAHRDRLKLINKIDLKIAGVSFKMDFERLNEINIKKI